MSFLRLLVVFSFAIRASFASATWVDTRTEFELGKQLGYGFEQSRFDQRRVYGSAKATATAGSAFEFQGFARFLGGSENELDLRTLSGVWNHRNLRVELGFQEIPWGETFGVQIADIVNPRDFRDPLFNEPAWTRLSVFALNTQLFLDKLTLQFVFTPRTRMSRLPDQMDGVVIGDAATPPGAEYGGKASYLFPSGIASGLDLGLFYFRHFSRTPAFTVRPSLSGMVLESGSDRVDTLGVTASQALGDWVMRLDSVFHIGQPALFSDREPVASANNLRLILGADHGLSESGGFGVQYHLDNHFKIQHWVSAMGRTSWGRGMWQGEIFTFRGMGNPDFWVQPKLTWFVNETLSWSLRMDLLWAGVSHEEGVLASQRDQDRVLSWISFKF